MYKIMIHIETHTGDTWFYYQEDGKDYVANTLQEIKDTALTLIDVYGEDCIKIVKQETGDENICCFEFIPINIMFEGYGAMGHPSAKTHARMGKELANYIRKFTGEQVMLKEKLIKLCNGLEEWKAPELCDDMPHGDMPGD